MSNKSLDLNNSALHTFPILNDCLEQKTSESCCQKMYNKFMKTLSIADNLSMLCIIYRASGIMRRCEIPQFSSERIICIIPEKNA